MAGKPQSIKGKGRDIFFAENTPSPVAAVDKTPPPAAPMQPVSVQALKRSDAETVNSETLGLDRVTLYIRPDQSVKLDNFKNQIKIRRKQKGLASRPRTIDRSAVARLAIDLLDEHDIEDLLRRLEGPA